MSLNLQYNIFGDDMQAIAINLNPGQSVRAEPGTMMYMDQGVQMQTNNEGGLLGGLKRMVTGESFFITSYQNNSQQAQIAAFAAPYPGKIITVELANYGGTFLCQRDSYLCSEEGIEVSIAFSKRLGAGFFGGEGFILQKLSGQGTSFIHAGGTVIERDLAQGQHLKVDTGCLVAFSESVDYDIEFIGGFKNTLFGGEGLFLAKLTGPGKVYLQSLPFSRMANRVLAAVGGGKDESGGILTSTLFGGD
jgi:uncharacterized protein (TIGR00266 family)